MQVLIGLSPSQKSFVQVSLGRNLVEHAIGVCNSCECQRNGADPNRLCGGDVISMNSLQQPLPASA